MSQQSTTWLVEGHASEKGTLPPEVVEAAVSRLRWISLICAGLTALAIYLESQLQPEVGEVLKDPKVAAVLLSVIVAAFGVNAIQRYRLLSPVAILTLGLVFEVVVAAAISFSETALPRSPDGPVLGASKVALWIGVVGLLIPNKPWLKLITALASATTWPCAYALNLHLYGYEPLPWNRLLIWIHLPYVMAFVDYGLSRRMWRMEQAVQKARDLGSYHLVQLIGRGGMGEVWRARHRMLARDAAIKLIRADLMIMRRGYDSDVVRKRFEHEAQAIASLRSPHTVHLYDFGVSEDGSPYYVMELLDGISLQVLVNEFGPQPVPRVLHMLRQACSSLEEAHRQGLIHRDIKPNNIFACKVGIEYDFVKVLDFGLVKNISGDESVHLTAPGGLADTPAYIAPEMASGKTIDARVDIYALGCVAYFLLTGSPVFEEHSAAAMVLAHVHKTPAPPSQRSQVPIPQELEAVILHCLAKDPAQRPQSAEELSHLLAGISESRCWTPRSAEAWWNTHLPLSCSYRTAAQTQSALLRDSLAC